MMKNKFFMVGLPAITRAMGRNLLTSKKVVLALCAMAVMGGSVFAQGADGSASAQKALLSVGGGGALNMVFSEYKPKVGGSTKSTYVGGGIFAFFDLTYAEIDLDLLFGNHKGESGDGSDLTHFGFSVLAKYPIALGSKFSLFPLVGIDYQIFMGGKDKDSDTDIKRADLQDGYKDTYDFFSIAFGAGGDFSLTNKLYLRGELLWNLKLNSKYENDMKDHLDSISNHGPRIKIGIGCKL